MEEKETTEDEMAGWHHQLEAPEFGAREVRCPCAWRGGACHCSRVMVGADWPSESKSPLVTQAFPIALLSILYPQHRECFTSYLELIGNPFFVSLHGY